MIIIGNLFSIFDPSRKVYFNVGVIFVLFLCLPSYWLLYCYDSVIFRKVNDFFFGEVRLNFLDAKTSSYFLILFLIFFSLLVNNFVGLIPYRFCITRQLYFVIFLSIPLWLGTNFISFMVDGKKTFANYVPTNSPISIVPFLVLVEFIRSLIRPVTLAIRLFANIVAGHLLLTLISRCMGPDSNFFIYSCLVFLIVLLLLESGVCLIQAYVFSLLNGRYMKEVYIKYDEN